ncbi:PNK3P-domain-containing protein [Neurospora crassa]|uniref:DNA kinase/phosphatase Pnk1 n=1 Tax=Neurospora crassa (strain ATCC 24698 / 74-OR23-1A / CBS 708.71 / DSM 1257 / FGSC 987) TaxID=367110 RepID=Q7S497_NEUCR|nr:DNA kinase/phosphatase Pnk1 [Neurospora crassa OR74A]EAA30326.3 DNA kinase/phosphatase Pnk1 [Neurospora crassa OR74A]KHE79210.1 PNK3P-domain-containing protein [Neurospora crassa]|eukprot:XP_959562.3 DNA kinase/phosphatase Pnk1 [Neurospora crassa OR74A]
MGQLTITRRVCLCPTTSLRLPTPHHFARSFSITQKVMGPTKRPAEEGDRSISPPPLKRKAQTAISKSAVASFFTPVSQKPKDRTTWTEKSPDADSPATLLVAKYVPEGSPTNDESVNTTVKRRKIAAFDLDSTLITSASGKKHSHDAADWKWWHHSVPDRLRKLYNEEGYQVIIFTNQGGLTLHASPSSSSSSSKPKTPKAQLDRVPQFKQKCSAVLSQLDIPTTLYAATGKDIYRKPRPGMWLEMKADYNLFNDDDIDLENSIFVGDAGGRQSELPPNSNGRIKATATPKDFSCSDRNLAHNVGIQYQTPEEFFLGEEPRNFTRDFDLVKYPYPSSPTTTDPDSSSSSSSSKKEEILFTKTSPQELVLFVGPPGAGKSTFYWRHLKPLGFERVNQDVLKSKDKCLKAATEYLKEGDSVVVDNTNPDPDTRKQWVELAKKQGVPVRCVWFRTPLVVCEHNDAVRALNKPLNPESRTSLPKLAFNSFNSRFKEPKVKEGFQDVTEVDFKFRGTKEEYEIWGKYWI